MNTGAVRRGTCVVGFENTDPVPSLVRNAVCTNTRQTPMGFIHGHENEKRVIKLQIDQCPHPYKVAGFYGVWNVGFCCFSDHSEEGEEPDFRPGRNFNIVVRFSVSAPNDVKAHNIRLDAWVGHSTNPSAIGATIDEQNIVLIPPEDNQFTAMTLKSMYSAEDHDNTDKTKASPFNGMSFSIERLCCCQFNVYLLPPLPFAHVLVTRESFRAYANAPNSKPMTLPSFIPKPPMNQAEKKRQREEKDAERRKRIASRRACCTPAEAGAPAAAPAAVVPYDPASVSYDPASVPYTPTL